MRCPAAFVLVSALLGGPLLAADVPKSHREHRLAGEAAYQRKDYVAAREAFAAALKLRPDSPRYLHNLAAMCAMTGDSTAALARLRELAALGVYLPVSRDPDFAALQGQPGFDAVLRALATTREPRGTARVLAELPDRAGIIEGIASRDRTGDLFLGDVHNRCIWKRDASGQVTRFSAEEDKLFGIFGLAIDERRNTLWAATSALAEMAGFTKDLKGRTALAEFNLTTGELRRIVFVPGDGRDHHLGDLVVAADGTVYATDSTAPVIWQLAPGATEIEKLLESPAFGSLQGIVFVNRTLVVADYANGLFAIELPGARLTPLAPPAHTTLLGLDGLAVVPGGLVASQNGIEPQRVVHLALSADLKVTSATVLAAALPNFTDLTLITLVNGRPMVIANSGWDGYDPAKAERPAAHTVRLFQLTWP